MIYIYIFPEVQRKDYFFLFFYVRVPLFLGHETIEVAIMCGRRAGENNKS